MIVDLVITNAQYLVTVDDENQILEDANLVIDKGVITQINPTEVPQAREVFDASGHLVMPGLINTHSHLAMSLLRGWAEGVDLEGFLKKVWVAEGAIMDRETCGLGTELAAGESLLAGVTTVLDMYFHPDANHEAAARVGLRHVGGPIFFDAPAIDGLTWEERISFARSWPTILKKIGGPEVPLYLMPHSTYTDSPEHLAEVGRLAKEIGARIHLHVSETLVENADVRSRLGQSPTALLKELGILDVPTIFGHGVHLTDDDVRIAAASGAGIAHCPGSNLKLGSGVADIKRYQDAGIPVGLGTDSCSSSNDLDLWPVLRTAAHLVALNHGPAAVDLTALVRAATIDGANAIGLESTIGSIEVGKDADLIAIDLDALHLLPIHNLLALLVYSVGRGDVSDVFVAGQHVVRARQLANVNVAELERRVNERTVALAHLR
jgi:5-methylthioadenosine/S-adenosylhomocysteine deaminase